MTDFETEPWLQTTEQELAKVATIPTLLSTDEQKLYIWLGKTHASNGGKIVDLGAFVGGSTARLALGAQAVGLTPGICAFDSFQTTHQAKEAHLYAQGISAFQDTEILWLAQDMLAPFAPLVSFHEGQIENAHWDQSKIDILAMDASKVCQKMDQMAETFFPSLSAGNSILVQRDFFNWRHPWIPIQMELFSDFFEPLTAVKRDAMIYRCIKTPSLTDCRERRVSYLDHPTLIQHLKDAQIRLEPFDLTQKLAKTTAAMDANKGVWQTWKMKAP